MSERFATNVEIGGDIPRSLIASLAEAIESAGLGLEWGDTSSTKDLRKALLGCDGKSTLHVKATELAGGDIDPLDKYCVSHGIAFTKRVDGKCEYNGVIHWWHPGLSGIQEWHDTDKQANLVMLQRETLEEALQKGKTLEQVTQRLREIAPQVPNIQIASKTKKAKQPDPLLPKVEAFDPFEL
jgi:hypothetical protein